VAAVSDASTARTANGISHFSEAASDCFLMTSSAEVRRYLKMGRNISSVIGEHCETDYKVTWQELITFSLGVHFFGVSLNIFFPMN
jgi:hypothetical protein